ncbi:MAG: hypothetical protein HY216_15395 [Candidatus Rokubacteria bacterium]|nr:hypothetical protein [Candidatus Rokubacteria bacterium]
MDELATALLWIDARSPRRSAAVVSLADELQIVAGARRGETSAGSGRLATVLSETLRGRRLQPATRDALALGLAGAMAASGDTELERARASVRAALVAAGVGDADILLVDRELRRSNPRR